NALLFLLALLLFQGSESLLLFQSSDTLLFLQSLLLFHGSDALLFFLALQFLSSLRLGFLGQPAPLVLTGAARHLFAFPGVALQQVQPVAGDNRKRRRGVFVYEVAQRRDIVQVPDALPGDPVALVEVIFRQQGDCVFGALAAAGLGIDVGGDAEEHDADF